MPEFTKNNISINYEVYGQKLQDDYTEPNYHQPSDNYVAAT